ncbi:MAG: hypothetical protein AAGC55_02200, partial [Myxococcota bacterium]
TRALVSMRELGELPGDPGQIEGVVHYLAQARLLGIEADPSGVRMVELIHESLIDSWPQLSRWLDEDQVDAAFLARVRTAAEQWLHSGLAEGTLWRDEAADEARRWQARYRGALAERELRYLEAVRALAERTARRRRQGRLIAIILLVSVIVVGMAALIVIERAETAADESSALASERFEKLERERDENERLANQLREALDATMAERDRAEKARMSEVEARERAEQESTRAQQESDRAQQAMIDAQRARDQAREAQRELQKLIRAYRRLHGPLDDDLSR